MGFQPKSVLNDLLDSLIVRMYRRGVEKHLWSFQRDAVDSAVVVMVVDSMTVARTLHGAAVLLPDEAKDDLVKKNADKE